MVYADRVEDLFEETISRAALAAAFHDAGDHRAARILFEEAESRQARYQPALPLLCSMQGFYYCSLLLDQPARAAWRRCLNLSWHHPSLDESVNAVAMRTARIGDWMRRGRATLLDAALLTLTSGRTALCRAILDGSSHDECRARLDDAVDRFRSAATLQWLHED